jgi:hypothetical protein
MLAETTALCIIAIIARPQQRHIIVLCMNIDALYDHPDMSVSHIFN